jgi:putative peptidoglycan lipid II flippase
MTTLRIVVATAITTAVSWLIWKGLDAVLGQSLIAELVELGIAGTVALWLYSRLVPAMRIPEAHQVKRLVAGRLAGR